MKKQLLIGTMMFGTLLVAKAQTVSSFENINLSANGVENASGDEVSGKFTSGNAIFNNTYNTAYGGYWSNGWAYSTIKNDSVGNATNLYGAYAKSGNLASVKYAVGQQGSVLGITGGTDSVKGLYITNGTYPALTIKNGDAFSKKFGGISGNDPDFFVITIKAWKNGSMKSDSVNFYLADYRFANNTQDYIVKDWTWVDLSVLGLVDSLSFNLNSSDAGQFGINTPLFFCIDDVVTKTDTADFENLNLAPNKFWNKPAAVLNKQYQSGNALFTSSYTVASFGDYWSKGFAISNKRDVAKDSLTNGRSKIYTAITGRGYDSSANYAIVQQNSVIRLTGNALGKQLDGIYVTNSNYAYLSMKWGDAFAKKFGNSDFFLLKVKGYKNGVNTDSVQHYLAQNGNISDTWSWVDLKPLGNVDSILFQLTSSDVGQFGMNTPAFFAIDNLITKDVSAGLLNVKHTLAAAVYPNPAQQFVHVAVQENVKQIQIQCFDLTGKLIHNQTTTEMIDLSGWQRGIYFIKIEADGHSTVKRLIVD